MARQYVLIVLAALSAFNFLGQQLMSILLEPVRHECSFTALRIASPAALPRSGRHFAMTLHPTRSLRLFPDGRLA